MIITRIIRKGRNTVISLVNEEQLEIRYEVFIKSGLRKGDDIQEKKIEELLNQNNYFIAKESAYKLLAVRLHSTKEIERKLLQKRVNINIIHSVINDLTSTGYLDDEKFTSEYFSERIRLKNISTRKIKQELITRGVPSEIINRFAAEGEEDLNEENALAAASKKMNTSSYRDLDHFKLRRKLFNYLMSKGFDYNIIKRVLDKLTGTQGSESDI